MGTVLVTGATRGIGRAICDLLLEQGRSVIGVAREPAIADAPNGYFPVALDLARLDEVDAALRDVVSQHPTLDTIISNAGAPAFGNLEEFSVQQIRASIDLNLTSHLLVARSTLPHLKRQARGDFMLIGSEAALRGGRRGSVYCAAKFGLRGLAESLRQECASSGVRVTIIHPGMVRTSFFDNLDFEPGPAKENAVQPADVARAVNMVLQAHPGTVFDEIAVSPLKKVVSHKSGRRNAEG